MEREKKEKGAKIRSAKDCALVAVFVALAIATQMVLTIVPGVELVTVLFVSFSFSTGWKKGMAAATVFSFLRQMVFGFFPTVLILYLIYYNLLAFCFGLLGKKIAKPYKFLILIVAIACVGTVVFTMIDNILTPLWYGYSARAMKAYFISSLPFMLSQVGCTAISTLVLFLPLWKVFQAFNGNKRRKKS